MHIVLATDADWIVDEVTAALGGPETRFTVCRDGRLVSTVVGDTSPDLVITDLQVGSMGGMAITMALRLDESGGIIKQHVPVVMLLDRQADVFLARRAGAEGWLVKPLDAMRLQTAAKAVVDGGTYVEGDMAPLPEVEPADQELADQQSADEQPADQQSAEEAAATAG